jgi:hypothetical protein
MPYTDTPSESPAPFESSPPRYQKLPIYDASQLEAPPSITTTSRSRWEFTKQATLAILMLGFTVTFVCISIFSIFLYDSCCMGWTWKDYAFVWSVLIILGILDSFFICVTIRQLLRVSVYSIPVVILVGLAWYGVLGL